MRLIDADVLRNALNDAGGTGAEHGSWADGWDKAIDEAICLVEKAPAVEPAQQWIPVAEKLPEENGKYIVTACYDIWNSTVVMVAEYYSGSRTWYDECCECSLEGIVTAWMPLPEPYTADAEENECVQPAHWEKADIPLPYQMRTVPTPSGTFAHREMYVCSACDGYNDKNTQYCPHCGARMDRKDGNG